MLLEQSLDQLLSVSGSALGSVLARSLLIILALTLVLLGYASWLSWRITRLQRLVSASVDDDGRILGPVPVPRSGDELGQLQQHFGQMVDRLQSYNRYLESFSRRLSHELKTPVAVVRSSLENLAHSQSETERREYLERASAATERLRRILTSMSEAARLEQSFDQADKEPFDLAEVASQACAAYQQLDVFNEGSQLPETAGVDIFGAFVTRREGKAEGHLGQGLLIVRLIADYHGGKVEAFNQHHNGIDGVCFRVIIPGQPA